MKLKELQNMPTETDIPVCKGSKLIGMSIKDIEKKFGVMVTSVVTADSKRIQVHSDKEIRDYIKKLKKRGDKNAS